MRRIRVIAATAAAATLLAACGSGTAEPAPPRFLSYGVDPGTTLAYASTVDMRYTMSADVPGVDDLGIDGTEMEMTMSGSVVYTYGAGPEPGTYTIDVTQVPGTIDRVMMDVMGERLEFDDTEAINALIPEIPPVAYRLVIDELGNLVAAEMGGTAIALDSLGLAGSGGMSGGGSAGQILGPAFSPEAVAVGDEWTWERTDDVATGLAITTRGTVRYVRDEAVDGRDTAVLEYRTVTDPFTLDAADLVEVAGQLGDLPAGEEEIAAMGESGFGFDVGETVVEGTVFFDATAGVVVGHDSTTTLQMGMSSPELLGGDIDMAMEVGMEMRLAG